MDGLQTCVLVLSPQKMIRLTGNQFTYKPFPSMLQFLPPIFDNAIINLIGYSNLMCIFQVACFPFDDHNCPPIQLVISFCQSAYSWLKEDIENVVVVHCKAGKARTGLMISSLLVYLKVNMVFAFITNYNQPCHSFCQIVLRSEACVSYVWTVLSYCGGVH